MTSSGGYIGNQFGSAARHIVVLLLLAVVCYFGVKALYSRIDNSFKEGRSLTSEQAIRQEAEPGQTRDPVAELDKEAITRRNLFLSSGQQRGGVNYGGPEAVSDGLQPDLLLVGTIVESGGLSRAVVLDVEKKEQVMLSEGDMINGASVRKITMGKVDISRQGRNELLDIAESAKLRAAITGQAVSASPANLGIVPDAPDRSRQEAGEREEAPVRVDLNRLRENNKSIIIKGRISDNI